MTTEERTQGGVNIKNANVTQLKAVANISFVDSDLMAKDEARIRDVLSDGSNLQLGLLFAMEASVNIVKHMKAKQMATPGKFTAGQTDGGRLDGRRDGRRGRGRVRGKRVRVSKIRRGAAEHGHETSTGVGVGDGSGYGGSREGDGPLVLEIWRREGRDMGVEKGRRVVLTLRGKRVASPSTSRGWVRG